MRSQPLIIRLCRHTFPDGHHCQGAAVRGRACCRHHLDARARLHNMARAYRRTLVLRWRVPESPPSTSPATGPMSAASSPPGA